MEFLRPKVPQHGQSSSKAAHTLPALPKDLPNFNFEDVTDKSQIGRGSFSTVSVGTYFNGTSFKQVVVKELLDIDNSEIVLKEARLMNAMKHKHIVDFLGICMSPYSIMMEYMSFEFKPFQRQLTVNCLRKFLKEVASYEPRGFMHVIPIIAKQITEGLKFMHDEGIVHRDIKPGNILVSNQHYCHIEDMVQLQEEFHKCPIICKLTDFGEGRSDMIQTESFITTARTKYIGRGTPLFMAPEICLPDRMHPMSIEDLKKVDMWALGLVFHNLVNPCIQSPYMLNFKKAQLKPQGYIQHMHNMMEKGEHVMSAAEYLPLQATYWRYVFEAFWKCTLNPDERPTADEVLEILSTEDAECLDKPLKCSQQTALETYDEAFAKRLEQVDGSIRSCMPENDGTNACPFLALRIGEQLTVTPSSDPEFLASMAEDVICNFPCLVNPHRSETFYDVPDAYVLLTEKQVMEKKFSLTEEIVSDAGVFSTEGQCQLVEAIRRRYREAPTFVGIYTCTPIIFVVGSVEGQLYLLDTHPVRSELGGNGNGILKMYTKGDSSEALCHWILKRLLGNVHDAEGQSLLILEPSQPRQPEDQSGTDCEIISYRQPEDQSGTDGAVISNSLPRQPKDQSGTGGAVISNSQPRQPEDQSGTDCVIISYRQPKDQCGTDGAVISNSPPRQPKDQSGTGGAVSSNSPPRQPKDQSGTGGAVSSNSPPRPPKDQSGTGGAVISNSQPRPPEDQSGTESGASLVVVQVSCMIADQSEVADWDMMKKLEEMELKENSTQPQHERPQGKAGPTKCGDKICPPKQVAKASCPENNSSQSQYTGDALLGKRKNDSQENHQDNLDSNKRRKNASHEMKDSNKTEKDGVAIDSKEEHDVNENKEQEFWKGNRRIPIFEKASNRYDRNEVLRILLKDAKQQKVQCKTHPLKVRENCSFIVNLTDYKDWQDVQADLNGVYDKNIRVGTWTVEVNDPESSDEVEYNILSKKVESLETENQFHLVQHCKKNKANSSLGRHIFLLKNKKGDIVNDVCLLQYTVTSDGNEVNLKVQQHGNSKQKKPFFPTKKSCLDEMKVLVKGKGTGSAYQQLRDSAGGACCNMPSDLPRSRQQVYDMKSKNSLRVDPVNDMLVYTHDHYRDIVLTHVDYPTDAWVLGTDIMCKDMVRFTTSENLSRPFSVDPTFNLGAYEVTPIVYKNLLLKSKRTGESPVFLGPTLIHHRKDYHTYKIMSSTVVTKCKGAANARGFITDGEKSLLTAFQDDFKSATGLRCFRHFQTNCTKVLHDIGIQKTTEQAYFLSKTFGVRGKVKGILDAEDEEDLRRLLNDTKKDLEAKEREVLGKSDNYTSKYVAYLEKNYQMIKTSMTEEARRNAGLPCDEHGHPVRSYTNQSESINQLMKTKKSEYLQENPGNDSLSKVAFTKHVFENIHDNQQQELALSLASLSEVYQLSEVAEHLEVPIETWFDWSKEDRQKYIAMVNKQSMMDIVKQKQIPWPKGDVNMADTTEYRQPSTDISHFLQMNMSYTLENAKLVEDSVKHLINHPTAIQREASLNVGQCKWQVASRHSKTGHVDVSLFSDHAVCSCWRYKHDKICSHSIAVAEKADVLEKHLQFLNSKKASSKNKTALAEKGVNRGVAGKKGGRNKYKYKSQQTPKTDAAVSLGLPYQKIYHNDNPFVLSFINTSAKRCKSCSIDFSHKQVIAPFDMTLSHNERWFFPKDGDWSNKMPSSKVTTRYYHTQSSCITERFPYFTKEFIEISEEVLSKMRTSHKELLTKEFGLEF